LSSSTRAADDPFEGKENAKRFWKTYFGAAHRVSWDRFRDVFLHEFVYQAKKKRKKVENDDDDNNKMAGEKKEKEKEKEKEEKKGRKEETRTTKEIEEWKLIELVKGPLRDVLDRDRDGNITAYEVVSFLGEHDIDTRWESFMEENEAFLNRTATKRFSTVSKVISSDHSMSIGRGPHFALYLIKTPQAVSAGVSPILKPHWNGSPFVIGRENFPKLAQAIRISRRHISISCIATYVGDECEKGSKKRGRGDEGATTKIRFTMKVLARNGAFLNGKVCSQGDTLDLFNGDKIVLLKNNASSRGECIIG